jgi:hypothetical protein
VYVLCYEQVLEMFQAIYLSFQHKCCVRYVYKNLAKTDHEYPERE